MPVAVVERKKPYASIGRLPEEKSQVVIEYVTDCPCGELNADRMSAEELSAKLKRGYDDIEAGRVMNAAAAFEQRRKNRK